MRFRVITRDSGGKPGAVAGSVVGVGLKGTGFANDALGNGQRGGCIAVEGECADHNGDLAAVEGSNGVPGVDKAHL